MSAARVLAIVVHYRNPAATARCLMSITRQTLRPELAVDLAVVEQSDGNADAGAIEAATRSAEAGLESKLYPSAVNLGFAGGSNLPLRVWLNERRYDYVWLLNPDAQAEPEALQALVTHAEAHPRTAAVASDLGSEESAGVVSLWRGWSGTRRVERPAWVSGASMLLRLEALREVGLFDENLFLYWEDVELCLRLSKAGWDVAVERASKVAHEGGGAVGKHSAAQDYYASRNALLLVRKHAPMWMPVAAVCVLGRVTAAKAARGEWGRLRASVSGWWDGVRGRGGAR